MKINQESRRKNKFQRLDRIELKYEILRKKLIEQPKTLKKDELEK